MLVETLFVVRHSLKTKNTKTANGRIEVGRALPDRMVFVQAEKRRAMLTYNFKGALPRRTQKRKEKR